MLGGVREREVAGLGFLMQQDPLFRTPVDKFPGKQKGLERVSSDPDTQARLLNQHRKQTKQRSLQMASDVL